MKLIVKKEKNKLYLILDNEKIILEQETILAYQEDFLLSSDVDTDKLNQIKFDNEFFYLYKLTIRRLKKAYTKSEIRNYLKSKTNNIAIIDKILKKLEYNKYINDVEYVKLYIENKKYQYGPKIIENRLLEKGISKKNILNNFDTYDEELLIEKIVSKNISKISGSKMGYQNKLISKLISKGFNEDMSHKVVKRQLRHIEYSEVLSLENDYKKIFNKFITKIEDKNELKRTIRIKLLNKGYLIDNIKKVEEI